jgi:hypothetical protein
MMLESKFIDLKKNGTLNITDTNLIKTYNFYLKHFLAGTIFNDTQKVVSNFNENIFTRANAYP